MLVDELRQVKGRIGFRTIMEAVVDAIAAQKLVPGQKLPPQRHLAQDIGVAVATVGRAYSELEAQGFLTSHVGRGTFIAQHPRKAVRAPRTVPSAVELGIYRTPIPDVRPGLAAVLAAIAASPQVESLLDGAPTVGRQGSREAVARWIRQGPLNAAAEDLVLTNGGQHAIMAALSGLTETTAQIATEELTDPRMKAVAGYLGHRLVAVSCDAEGMLPDDLDRLCRVDRPDAVYLTPRYQNPTNVTMPLGRRQDIVTVARRHGLMIIESDIYGTLAEDTVLPLRELAPERTYHLSSFGRIAGMGMKLGWLVAPPGKAKDAQTGVAMSTGIASPLMAELAARMIADGTMARMRQWQRIENRHRLSQLRGFPGLAQAHGDPVSAHVWLQLPEPWRADDLVDAAGREHGISIAPPHTFVVGRRHIPHAVRLVIGAPASQEQLLWACARLEDLLTAGPRPSSIVG